VPFRAERRALRKVLDPDEEVLASDFAALETYDPGGVFFGAIHGLGAGGVRGRMVFIVTDRAVYVRSPAGIVAAPLDRVIGVGRKRRKLNGLQPAEVQVNFPAGAYWTLQYDPRAREQPTADVLTEWFFGRVIADTIEEFENRESSQGHEVALGDAARSIEVSPGIDYEVGELVEIANGPYRDFSGRIREISDDGTTFRVGLSVYEGAMQIVDFHINDVAKM